MRQIGLFAQLCFSQFRFIHSFVAITMEYFDASEELHNSIEAFMRDHDGQPPRRIYIAPGLYKWLNEIRRDESLLHGKNPESIDFSTLETEVGTLELVIDELLSDYEIIAEG
jgi:hypothetical protein